MSVEERSADSHIELTFLPPDTFTSRVPAAFRDRAPRMVDEAVKRKMLQHNVRRVYRVVP